MNSHYNIQYEDTGMFIYFDVDMKELFGVTLKTSGVPTALNLSFNEAKKVIPYRTGLMLRSFTMVRVSQSKVRCFFDPKKILGKKRLGKIVTEYYPQYLIQYPKRFNWLDLVMGTFFRTLEHEMEKISKRNEDVDMVGFKTFMTVFKKSQRKKLEEEKKHRTLKQGGA